jgi:8-oxo-dGTP diphosphatase
MPHSYDYPRPALTVDIAVFALDQDDLQVMLVQRDVEPQVGQWSLPGGFVQEDETLEEAARRELEDETGLKGIYFEQLYTFGDVKRDPRHRVVTVAHYALVNLEGHEVRPSRKERNAAWFLVSELPTLAFDHETILEMGLERLRGKVRYQPIGFELLPRKFPLRELQHMYEVILDRKLDKRNFRKKILSMDILVELNEIEKDVAHRAARLYKFDKKKYDRKTKKGFNFEL